MLLLFSLISLFPCLFLAARCLLVSVCWRQELEHHARDRYGALDQMSTELRQLREQRDALDALAEALKTQDGWLAYRVEALRDQLLELEGQPTARPSAIERVRTALIDRDEALQQARGGRREGAHRGDRLGGGGDLPPGPEPGGPRVAPGGAVPAKPGRGEGARG
jgi:hypothetical protein